MIAKLFGENDTQILFRICMENDQHGIEISLEDDNGNVYGGFHECNGAEDARALLEELDERKAMVLAAMFVAQLEADGL